MTASRRRPVGVGVLIWCSNSQSCQSLRPPGRRSPGWRHPLRRDRLRKEMRLPLLLPKDAQQTVEGPQPVVRAEGAAGLIDEGKRVGVPVAADGREGKIALEDVGTRIASEKR